MKIRFWGVRGSIPAPGPETNRYGGNTSCVSLESPSGHLIIIDMGTGVMGLGNELMRGDFGRGNGLATVLLSHSHWDHIQGFGFFPPIFVPGNHFDIFGNASSPGALEGILEGQMNPHYSPLQTLRNLGATLSFESVVPGRAFEVGDVRVTALANPHGATTALAYRLEAAGRVVVYASDVGYPAGGPPPAVVEHYRGADLLIHDATYTPRDQATRRERGLSSYADAVAAAIRSESRHLVLFHYDQDYADPTVDEMGRACRAALDRMGASRIKVTAAAEGLELTV